MSRRDSDLHQINQSQRRVCYHMNLFTLDICHSVEYTPTGINFMLFASLILDFWGVLNVNLKFAKLYPVGIELLTVAAFSSL